MTTPTSKPTSIAKAGTFERHMSMASGSNSPKTTYSMAPLAKLSENASMVGLSVPRKYPSIAPRMVGAPVMAVMKAAFTFFMPPATSGTATAIPSGMLCSPITIAIARPPTPPGDFVARVGRADDHALGEIMQRYRERHDQPRDKELAERLLVFRLLVFLFVLVVMVAVDELRKLIGRSGVVLVDMPDLRIRLFVDESVEQKNHTEPDGRHGHDEKNMTDGIGDLSQSVREQIQTDYAEHDSARKAEQQTDYLFGVTGEYDTYRTAQACTHDAGNSRNDDNKRKCTHVKTLSEAMRSSARMKRLPCDRPFNLYHSTNRLQVQLFTRRLRLSSRLFCVAFLFRI